jgi:heptosyltransferase-2
VTKRVLLVPKGYLGDLVLTSPTLEALKASDPQTHVTVLVPPQFVSYVKSDPLVDDVIVFDRRKTNKGWRALRAFAEEIRSRGFDRAYSFHRSPRTSVLLWLAGVPERVGYRDAYGAFLYTRRVVKTARCHEVIRNLELVSGDLSLELQGEIDALKRPGPTAVSERFFLRIPDTDTEDISESVRAIVSAPKPYVVLSPGSAWETKRWSSQGFREVAQGLVARGNRIVVVGAPDDAQACRDVVAGLGEQVVDTCGRTTLLELIYIIRHCQGVVCNDSLALHVASAARRPTVAVYCATSPLFGFGPWKNRAIVVEKGDLFCKPCRRHGSRTCPTGTNACITGVSSDLVLQAILDVMSESLRSRVGTPFQVISS